MVKLLGALCLYLVAVQAATAVNVTTVVDRENVRPGESLVVTYSVDGRTADPDFSALEKDFRIVDRGQSRNITVSGGDASVEVLWRLVLEPRRSGKLSLPAVRFDDQLSDARTITVAEAAAARDSDEVRIEYGVDDPTPYVHQQLVLTVKVRTPGSIEELDVSMPRVVQGDARVNKLGGDRQYETVRDSRRYEVYEQRYTLVPGSAGMLRLSPVEIRGRINGSAVSRRSAPLVLEVLRALASDPGRGDDVAPDDLFLEVELDKHSPYVQEQVLYTVRVLRAVAIENATLSKPVVSGGDAVIEQLGDDRRYQASRGGRRYAVTERRFVVFPQTSGTLTIGPVLLNASVPLPSAGINTTGFWNQPLTRSMRIESEPRALTVKAPPADAPSPWLPARSVTLEEDWPERDSVDVGAPITRRITLSADALMASQLPDLDVPLPDAVKSYPERPRRETSAGEQGVSGRLDQTMAIIPSEAGVLTVPALELEWWNTATDRKERARLPAHTLEVAAISVPPADEASRETAPSGAAASGRAAWWLSLVLGLAWLATLVLWWRDRRRPGAAGESRRERPVSRRRAEAGLQDACRAGDPRAARDALLAWGRACWPERPPPSLGALGQLSDDPVAAEIVALQEALYARHAASWRGDRLYEAVASFEPGGGGGGRRPHTLKPLYQH